MLPGPTPSEDDRKIQDNKYREILRDRELGWKITANHYIMTWQKHSGDKHNFSFVCASVYVCLGVGVLVVPTYLVDPVQDEGHAGHEGGLEHAGVPLPPLLDHARLVRQGVRSAVA